MKRSSSNGRNRFAIAAVILALALAAALFSGCSDPVTIYQVPGDYMASGKKVLVIPFMDTRTFVDDKDPHREDMGKHARDIFVTALREKTTGIDLEILTPEMIRPRKSLTNAEVAEMGRQHSADAVVAGQIFSFTDTRAASIPPRAGMFVRVISASDGALLFVGDHYQAAAIPGASGGRERQAMNVATRLIEGFMNQAGTVVAATGKIASATALAVIAPPLPAKVALANKSGKAKTAGGKSGGDSTIPGLIGNNLLTPGEWDEQIVPEVPPLLDFDQDFYQTPVPPLPAAPAQQSPASAGEPAVTAADAAESVAEVEDSAATDAEPESDVEAIAEASDVDGEEEELPDLDDLSALDDMPEPAAPPSMETAPESESTPAAETESLAVDTQPESEQSPESPVVDEATYSYTGTVARAIDELPELDFGSVDTTLSDSEMRAVVEAAEMSGDELAADLFDSEDTMMQNAASAPRRRPARAGTPEQSSPRSTLVPQPATADVVAAANPAPVPASLSTEADHYGPFEFDPDTLELRSPLPVAGTSTAAAKPATRRPILVQIEDDGEDGDGPVVSTPIAIEQPRGFKADEVEPDADPAIAIPDADALVAAPSRISRPGARRVLILPYHDRANPNNLINHTGGGEVVTTLYGTQLGADSGIQVMWDASGQATHNLLLTRDEAIRMGRLAGADYVVRGQVVEFRRAQSVPSFYSAVISTAMLAAQMFFAEMSGVDVATEVYRVSDGMCVMSRRDRAQQKYVVQAEKTVRRMAANMAASVIDAVKAGVPEAMDPLIDELEPVTVMERFK